MELLSYLNKKFRFKWIIGLLLICSVAFGAKFFDTVILDVLQVNGGTADTVTYLNGSKQLTSSGVNSTELSQLETMNVSTISANQWFWLGELDQSLITTASPTFAGLTLSGATADTVPYFNGSKALTSSAVNSTELGQLATIDTETISNAQWAYLGELDQSLITTADVDFNSVSVTDPLIMGEEASTPATPSSTLHKLYFKDDNKLYHLDDTGAETEVGSGGGGSGSKNYILNSDLESDTAAATSAADVSSSDANLTVLINDTSPLAGSNDLEISKAAANITAQYIEFDAATLDVIDRGKELIGSFAWTPGASYTDNYLNVRAVDQSGNYLPTINPDMFQNTDGVDAALGIPNVQDTYYFRVQTESSTTKVKIRFPYIHANSVAQEIGNIDEVKLGPEGLIPGAIMTDWEEYTPTFTGFGTVSSVDFFWRRVGSNMHIMGKFTTGTNTATQAQITLPNSETIDSTVLPNVGVVGEFVSSYATAFGGNALGTGGDAFIAYGRDDTATSALTELNGNSLGNTVAVSVNVTVPITGWKASNLISTAENLFKNAFIKGAGNGGTAITALVTDITFTETQDDLNLWDGDQFTAPEDGEYEFNGMTSWAANAANRIIYAYVDGVLSKAAGFQPANASTMGFNGTIKLSAGEVLSFRCDTAGTLSNSTTTHHVSINSVKDTSVFGVYGEINIDETSSGTRTSYPGTNWFDAGSLTLAPGLYKLWGSIGIYNNGAITAQNSYAAISENSGTTTTDHQEGKNQMARALSSTLSTFEDSISVAPFTVQISTETTYYIKSKVGASATNLQYTYSLFAEKIK